MREARISIVNTGRPGTVENGADSLATAKERIECVGRDRPDLILLSELFACSAKDADTAAEIAQVVPGPISEELAALARDLDTHIAFGLLRRHEQRILNSLVVLDRRGVPAWIYDKVSPVDSEMLNCGISPGGVPVPFSCEFGRVGAAICFDINYNEVGQIYFDQQIELLLFASAFPAGRLLDAWALRFGFAIAASTYYDHNRIIDCTGITAARTSDHLPYATAVMNLNRRVVHMDYNLDKLNEMRSAYAGDVIIEDLRDEGMCVITSLKRGLEVVDLMKEFDVMTLPAYFAHSRQVREQHGGLPAPRWY